MPTTKFARVCPVCGKSFQPSPKASRQRYDSIKCKKTAYRRRARYVGIPVQDGV